MTDVNELMRLFKAVANKRRLEILRLLSSKGEKNVSEVAECMDISIMSASRHLLQLERVGLLKNRQQSIWIYYSINDKPSPIAKNVLQLITESKTLMK
ncbi:winged helix-turn-helix transcriptional regulator [candidate division WOR-3 bacterium]|nr:winged helix-turn-helix transcriptional regulator [candidate division WOR-3 bacterium]